MEHYNYSARSFSSSQEQPDTEDNNKALTGLLTERSREVIRTNSEKISLPPISSLTHMMLSAPEGSFTPENLLRSNPQMMRSPLTASAPQSSMSLYSASAYKKGNTGDMWQTTSSALPPLNQWMTHPYPEAISSVHQQSYIQSTSSPHSEKRPLTYNAMSHPSQISAEMTPRQTLTRPYPSSIISAVFNQNRRTDSAVNTTTNKYNEENETRDVSHFPRQDVSQNINININPNPNNSTSAAAAFHFRVKNFPDRYYSRTPEDPRRHVAHLIDQSSLARADYEHLSRSSPGERSVVRNAHSPSLEGNLLHSNQNSMQSVTLPPNSQSTLRPQTQVSNSFGSSPQVSSPSSPSSFSSSSTLSSSMSSSLSSMKSPIESNCVTSSYSTSQSYTSTTSTSSLFSSSAEIQSNTKSQAASRIISTPPITVCSRDETQTDNKAQKQIKLDQHTTSLQMKRTRYQYQDEPDIESKEQEFDFRSSSSSDAINASSSEDKLIFYKFDPTVKRDIELTPKASSSEKDLFLKTSPFLKFSGCSSNKFKLSDVMETSSLDISEKPKKKRSRTTDQADSGSDATLTKLYIPCLPEREFLIGKEVSNLLKKRTFNLYRSMKLRGIRLYKLLPEQVETLTTLNVIPTGIYSLVLVPYNDGIKFLM
eukprot:TRINITY_DN2441_c0_g3_i2.p1 TRINITY_DN2441_c0_g3~~TRINITY_DN2441_c0_g3_i2.p1  ORF type:complete len:650 (-),score=114.81 TRINITY_DN2441_c0_g3_i2:90-2039(-)